MPKITCFGPPEFWEKAKKRDVNNDSSWVHSGNAYYLKDLRLFGVYRLYKDKTNPFTKTTVTISCQNNKPLIFTGWTIVHQEDKREINHACVRFSNISLDDPEVCLSEKFMEGLIQYKIEITFD